MIPFPPGRSGRSGRSGNGSARVLSQAAVAGLALFVLGLSLVRGEVRFRPVPRAAPRVVPPAPRAWTRGTIPSVPAVVGRVDGPGAGPVELARRWTALLAAERARASLAGLDRAFLTADLVEDSRRGQVAVALVGCELQELLSREPAAWDRVMDYLDSVESDSDFRSLMMVLDSVQTADSHARWAQILRSASRPESRRRAVWALSFSSHAEGLTALLGAVERDPDREVRAAALRGLETDRRAPPSPTAWAEVEQALGRCIPLEEDGSVRTLESALLSRSEGASERGTGRRVGGRRSF